MKILIYPLLMMLICLTLSQAYSQQLQFKRDFIVTLKGDTVEGQVKKSILRKSGKMDFTPSGQLKAITYKPQEINAFYSQDEGFFISAGIDLDVSPTDFNSLREDPNPEIKRDTVFLKVIMLGKANLYALDDDAMKLHFFISKEGIPITELINYSYLDRGENYWDAVKNTPPDQEKDRKSNRNDDGWNPNDAVRNVPRYKGILNFFFSDCARATRKIENLSFDEGSLRGIFNIYNNCDEKASEKYTSDYQRKGMELFGFIGPSFSGVDYNLKGEEIFGFKQKYGFTAGIDLKLRMGYKYRFASILNSLQYSQFKTLGEKHYKNGVVFYDQYARITSSVFSLSTMLRLSYPDMKFIPFVNLGVRNVLVLLPENSFEVTTTVGGEPSTRNSELVVEHYLYHFSTVAGAGIQYKHFGIELRYFPYFGMDLDPAIGRGLLISSFDLNLSYKIMEK